MRRARLQLALASAAVLAAGPVAAGGLIIPVAGAKAQSMGGAWIAQGDDIAVLDHNPAQLVRQRRIAAEVNYTGFLYHGSVDLSPVAGVGDPPPAGNDANKLKHIPNLYAAFPIGERWTIAGGIISPIGPEHHYTDEGAQRYQLQQAQLQLAWGTLHAAWRPIDALAFSAGVDVGYPWATQKLAIGLVPGFRSLDGSVHVDGKGKLAPRAKLGVLLFLDKNDRLSIGALGAHAVDLTITGKIKADVPVIGLVPSDRSAQDNIEATQTYPAEARLGVGYRDDRVRAELAGRYFHWSAYTEQSINLEREVIGGFEFGDLTIPKSYRNSFTVQAGGGLRLAGSHELRAGYMFDQAAARNERLQINDMDADKHMVGGGWGTVIADLIYLNAAYAHIFYPERTVRGGSQEAISVIGGPRVTNDGTYNWRVDLFAINAGVMFR